MARLDEAEITRAILRRYCDKLADRIIGDVLIVGSGPAGMTAAYYLAREGWKVTVLEKRLAPGGGVWGGGMAMNEAAVQDEALEVLDEFDIRHRPWGGNLHTVDTMELAAALCVQALRAGAVLLNLTMAEDVCVLDGRVAGVVANRTMICEALPIDPITLRARATIDSTGHEASVVAALRKRRLWPTEPAGECPVEGPMDATAGENFVVERAGEVYPGLWVSGMSVCAALGGPRMGPIFGGMVLSGRRVAEQVAAALRS